MADKSHPGAEEIAREQVDAKMRELARILSVLLSCLVEKGFTRDEAVRIVAAAVAGSGPVGAP